MAKKTLAKVTITPELAGWTIAAILKDELHLSARQRQKVVRTRGIRLDGKQVHSLVKVKVGQVLEVLLPEVEQVKVPARPMDLDVLYEDEYLLVVNKPAGMTVHNVQPDGSASLAEGVAYYFQQHGRVITPRPVHRLDKDASGVVIFAKSAQIQEQLTKAWPEAEKIYWVQVHGRAHGKWRDHSTGQRQTSQDKIHTAGDARRCHNTGSTAAHRPDTPDQNPPVPNWAPGGGGSPLRIWRKPASGPALPADHHHSSSFQPTDPVCCTAAKNTCKKEPGALQW